MSSRMFDAAMVGAMRIALLVACLSHKAGAFTGAAPSSKTLSIRPLSLFEGSTSGFDEHPIQLGDSDDGCSVKIDKKLVYLVCDSSGVTPESAFQKSLAQFDSCDERFYNINREQSEGCNVKTKTYSYVNEEALASIIKEAHDRNALVVFTFSDPTLRHLAVRMCEMTNVLAVDVLGPTLSGLSGFLNVEISKLRPKQKRLSNDYFRRIEAVEFTLKADDGQSPWLLKEAEVVIVGVSRTGKTPLSVVLSQTMGLKVANVPLVYECPLPKELFQVNSKRVFCLTIAPSELKRIRTSRLDQQQRKSKNIDGAHNSNYADRAYLLKDLRNARELSTRHDWTEIDVTGRAVEETASHIYEVLNARYEEGCS